MLKSHFSFIPCWQIILCRTFMCFGRIASRWDIRQSACKSLLAVHNIIIKDGLLLFIHLLAILPKHKSQIAKAKIGVELAGIVSEILESRFFSVSCSFTGAQLKASDDQRCLLQAMMLLDTNYVSVGHRVVGKHGMDKKRFLCMCPNLRFSLYRVVKGKHLLVIKRYKFEIIAFEDCGNREIEEIFFRLNNSTALTKFAVSGGQRKAPSCPCASSLCLRLSMIILSCS